MGFYLAPPKLLVNRVMRDFMGHSIFEVQRHIGRKHPRIEAQPAVLAFVAIHARGRSGKVEARLNTI